MAKKARQAFLPGTEPQKNKRVHPLAENYAGLRDARIAANREEKDAHDALLNAMQEEGIDSYEYGDLKVVVNNRKKCKVMTPKHKAEENGEE